MIDRDQVKYKYRAFISYSRGDRRIGERFQRELEKAKIPKKIRGRNEFGRVPKRLAGLTFRDQTDAEPHGDARERFVEALEQSAYLIVLCSPRSADREWVNFEIETFKRMGRGDRIIAVVVEGEPLEYPQGVFPPALVRKAHPQEGLTDEIDTIPLAASLKPLDKGGDGWDSALKKVLARLCGVSLSEYTQRADEARRFDRRITQSVIASLSVLAIAASGLGIFSLNQLEDSLDSQSTYLDSLAQRDLDAWYEGDGESADSIFRALLLSLEGAAVSGGLTGRALVADQNPAFHTVLETGTENRAVARLSDLRSPATMTDFDPVDGRYLYSVHADGALRLWDLEDTGNRMPTVLSGHTNEIYAARFSADRHYLATGSLDGRTIVYDLQDLTRVPVVLQSPDNIGDLEHAIVDVQFSPDGLSLATASWDGCLRVWDFQASEDKRLTNSVCPGMSVNNASFSNDGRYIVTGALPPGVWIWDLEQSMPDAARLLQGSEQASGNIDALFSPDGKFVVSVSSGETRIWDMLKIKEYDGYEGYVLTTEDLWSSPVFDPKSMKIAAATGEGTVIIWTLLGGTFVKADELHVPNVQASTVDFSPDGEYLVASYRDGRARVWALGSEEAAVPTLVFGRHGEVEADGQGLVDARFDASGNFLLTLAPEGSVMIWRLNNSQDLVRSLSGHNTPIRKVQFSDDGEKVVAASASGKILMWDLSDAASIEPAVLGDWDDPVGNFELSKDAQRLLVSTSKRLFVTETSSGGGATVLLNEHGDDRASFNSAGTHVLGKGRNRGLLLWDLEANDPVVPARVLRDSERLPDNYGATPRFSPDDNYAMSRFEDLVFVWDLSKPPGSNARVLTGHGGNVWDSHFDSTSRRVVGAGNNRTILVWDLTRESNEPLYILKNVDTWYADVRFHPRDSRYLLAISSTEQRLDIWDLEAEGEQRVRTLRLEDGGGNSGCYGPEGNFIGVLNGRNSSVALWDLREGAEAVARRLGFNRHVVSYAFSPDEEHLVTGSDDGTVLVWPIDPSYDNVKQICQSLRGPYNSLNQSENRRYGITDRSQTSCERLFDGFGNRLYSSFSTALQGEDTGGGSRP